jgi:hypothetical protein
MVGTVGHYAFHYTLSKATGPRVADRFIWAAMSIGACLMWTNVFYNAMPFGYIGVDLIFAKINIHFVIRMLLGFQVMMAVYYVLTAFTSRSAPRGFMSRKIVPALIVLAAQPWLAPASVSVRITSWLLRYMWFDALLDIMHLAWRYPHSKVAVVISRVIYWLGAPNWIYFVIKPLHEMSDFLGIYRYGPLAYSLYVLIVEVNPLFPHKQ